MEVQQRDLLLKKAYANKPKQTLNALSRRIKLDNLQKDYTDILTFFDKPKINTILPIIHQTDTLTSRPKKPAQQQDFFLKSKYSGLEPLISNRIKIVNKDLLKSEKQSAKKLHLKKTLRPLMPQEIVPNCYTITLEKVNKTQDYDHQISRWSRDSSISNL